LNKADVLSRVLLVHFHAIAAVVTDEVDVRTIVR
jgi:hypothetical protein